MKEEPVIETINDVYDLMELATRINTNSEILNKDFTLAVTDEKIERWSIKQIYGTKLLYNAIKNGAIETDSEEDKDFIKELSIKTSNNLIHEVITRLAFTRSRNGKVLNAILKVPVGENGKEEKDNSSDSFLKKLFSKKTEVTDDDY